MAKRGFSIRIYVKDGTAEGLRVVEKSNWTGRGVICPRNLSPELKSREEFSKTGVYILYGPSESGGLPVVYIGEGDPTRPGVEQHFAKKDFWTRVVLFTSKDENLNKAHVQYLESRLVAIARDAKRCTLDNSNAPTLSSLSEADIDEVETFLDEMLLIFPVIGVSAFETPLGPQPTTITLYLSSQKAKASGFESADGLTVRKGSAASKDFTSSSHDYLKNLRATLVDKGILAAQSEHYVLTQDYTFDSPSTASGVMLGRNSNGREAWRDAQGRTLKEIQESSVQIQS